MWNVIKQSSKGRRFYQALTLLKLNQRLSKHGILIINLNELISQLHGQETHLLPIHSLQTVIRRTYRLINQHRQQLLLTSVLNDKRMSSNCQRLTIKYLFRSIVFLAYIPSHLSLNGALTDWSANTYPRFLIIEYRRLLGFNWWQFVVDR